MTIKTKHKTMTLDHKIRAFIDYGEHDVLAQLLSYALFLVHHDESRGLNCLHELYSWSLGIRDHVSHPDIEYKLSGTLLEVATAVEVADRTDDRSAVGDLLAAYANERSPRRLPKEALLILAGWARRRDKRQIPWYRISRAEQRIDLFRTRAEVLIVNGMEKNQAISAAASEGDISLSTAQNAFKGKRGSTRRREKMPLN